MVNSYLNIILFLLTTIFYYITLKPALSYSIHNNNKTEYNFYINNSYIYLALYVLLVVITQCAINTYVVMSKCGGTIEQTIWPISKLTLTPWMLMFGVLVVVLVLFPGFKSAFSDIFGYYYISNSASKLLKELFIDVDETQEWSGKSPENKVAFESISQAIINICGNNSSLLNQIVPSNFNQYWNILRPLMKDKYKYETPESEQIKEELFNLSVTRDNIGEASWYIYTGLLLIMVVQYKIANNSCESSRV